MTQPQLGNDITLPQVIEMLSNYDCHVKDVLQSKESDLMYDTGYGRAIVVTASQPSPITISIELLAYPKTKQAKEELPTAILDTLSRSGFGDKS